LKVFIDASALVAIIAREPDHLDLQKRLKRHRRRTISAFVVYEATLALTRIGGISIAEALELVMQFQKTFAVQEVSIELRFAAIALEAFRRYGRGQGHKARLNMGDCFTYACATVLKVPLLFKGDDFIHTDVSIA
jgi:ribonuclease VapC